MRGLLLWGALCCFGCSVTLPDIPTDAQFSCSTDADCPPGRQCTSGLCGNGPHANGGTCVNNQDCASGACIEGICCNQACSAQDPASCGQTGHCVKDGLNTGQCELFPDGTACKGASCSNGQYLPAQTCDGNGTCPAGTAGPCPKGAACQDAVTCVGQCTVGTQKGCQGGAWCRAQGSGTVCVSGQQVNGDACRANGDCVSAHCDHNLCCSGGTCCATGDTSTCPAPTALCTSVATCHGESTSYSCTNHTCAPVVSTANSLCNGQTASNCGNFKDAVCGTSSAVCPTSCLLGGVPTDALCDSGFYCGAAGSCLPKSSNGTVCSAGSSCVSGHCANNLCCDSGSCCNSASDCSALVAATCDDPANCQGTVNVPVCSNFTCESGARVANDSACNYNGGQNPTHVYLCSNNFAFRCNGATNQVPSCPTNCDQITKGGPGPDKCSGNDELCAPGHTCVGFFPACGTSTCN